jgi:RNA polymerase sigma factor (sigma-70 family)
MKNVTKIDWLNFNPENPDLEAVEKWVMELAEGFVKGGYRDTDWMEELAFTGYLDILKVWQKHRHKPPKEWKAYMATVAINAMKRVMRKENAMHGIRPKSKEPEPTGVIYSLATLPVSEKERMNRLDQDGDVLTPDSGDRWEDPAFVETVQARQMEEVILRAIYHILTPSERRVMLMVIQSPDLTDAEIAERLGDMTPGSVRAHKCNARKKLKSYLKYP